MADPAPSEIIPIVAPERRVSPADQMAASTGNPVERSQPDVDEVAENAPDLTQVQEIEAADAAIAALEESDPLAATPPNTATSDSAQTPVSPPAPRAPVSSATPPNASAPAGVKPQHGQPPAAPSFPNAQDHPVEASRGPQGTASVNGAAIVAAALTGGLRRAEPPAPSSQGAPFRDAGEPALPSLLDRLAIRSILDNLRRQEPSASALQSAPPPGVMAAAPATASPLPDATARAASPAGGLRDKLGVFTADRMQPRRDAEQMRRAAQAGTAVLASLEALQRQETTGILMKIRDAANANGGIERVLSEMRPGGAFEDLRKEFNVALSRDEGFAAAYEKATGALSNYAEARAAMISAPRPRADVNLARLETLDQEIGAAAKTLPGLKDGKNALDEALEGGKEAVEKAFTAVRQTFTRDADARGPSPSPSFGP